MTVEPDEVKSIVLATLADLTAIPADQIPETAQLIRDLRLDGDDFSLVFVPSVEKALNVKTDPLGWEEVYTVQQAIDFLRAAVGRLR